MSTDLGPIEATAERERKLPLPPVLREFARIGGIVLLIGGAQKKAGCRKRRTTFSHLIYPQISFSYTKEGAFAIQYAP